jgi:Uma2 family endonuclease
MAEATTRLMTVAEYERIPEESRAFYYELHHGELVKVSHPKAKHLKCQRRLRQLLERASGDSGIVELEVAFRPLPEHEVWAADVAFISRARWEAIDPDGYLEGARSWWPKCCRLPIRQKRSLTKRRYGWKAGAGNSGCSIRNAGR